MSPFSRSCANRCDCLLAAVLAIFAVSSTQANVRLPALFSDHMVLQRDVSVPVWGWADAGEPITVQFAGQEKNAVADAAGKWTVKLDPLKTGNPQTLVVQGKNTVTIQDVLVGEVWLGSGQSNMDFPMGWQGEENIATAATINDPQMRYFDVPHKGSLEPESDVVARWQVATPATVKGWSAVGTYFSRNLREKLGVPVGFIKSSYGGTPAAPWVSIEALDRDPAWKATAEKEITAMREMPEALKAFPGKMREWLAANGAQDPGDTATEKDWPAPGFSDSDWKDVEVPTQVRMAGLKAGGLVWYRKTFVLPPTADKAFDFDLGWVNDGAVTVFFNGGEVKPTAPYERFMKAQLRFHVPRELVQPGQPNVLAVRLHALTPGANWGQPASRMNLPVADPKALDSRWKLQVAKMFPPLAPGAAAALPPTPMASIQNTSSALYNAMIHPILRYACKGALWYQGESNTGSVEMAFDYRRLLPALIGDWRTRWGEGNFPFYIVQLANYGAVRPQPSESNWAILRESQNVAAAAVPNSGVAILIDIGEGDNIHPRNKKEVGRRLTLLALNKTYGQKMQDSGPVFNGMKIEGSTVHLSFTEADGGLESRGGPLRGFAIAGADKKFVWADARIDGEAVLVSSPQVASPAAVRYAWADNPEGCNLYNKAGLPASPFRTDAL